MPEPVIVFRARSEIEAAVVQALLDAHGIEASVSSDSPQAVFPLAIDGLGEVRLAVCAEDAEAATRLIDTHREDAARQGQPATGEELSALEGALGYRFRDRGLLEHALTHRSRANEDVSGGVVDNESLEFLGDAVLGFVIADMLYRRYPDRDEGQKSKMKSGVVSAVTLARMAARVDLGRFLLLGRGEEKSGGRLKATLLADAYEAVIAAIYLDGGLDGARSFVEREFAAELAATGASVMPGDDFKSALQEWLQSRGRPLPDYQVVEEIGPAHRRIFRIECRVSDEVLASGEGRTKKEAEQDAARLALARFGESLV
jgi:ribonuclease-3